MSKFESEKDLARFIRGHAPFAVKPQRDSKYVFVNPWKTIHGRNAVLAHITEQLWIKLNEDNE